MRRVLNTIVRALLVQLCLAAAFFWCLSGSWVDTVRCDFLFGTWDEVDAYSAGLINRPGRIRLELVTLDESNGLGGEARWSRTAEPRETYVDPIRASADPPAHWYAPACRELTFPGYYTLQYLQVPHWLLMAASAILWALLGIPGWRRRRRPDDTAYDEAPLPPP
jgi:hypothetical protein